MSTQYNKVQRPYDEWSKSTIARAERANIREIVLPFIKDATVLDLACGSGFFSHAFLRWGASKIVGVDVSSAMVEEARSLVGDSNEAIQFIVADGSKLEAYSGGPFDIVFGGWFLNYARTGKEMVEMYKNILLNLKPGGHFVAVTPRPTNDPKSHIEHEMKLRPRPTASGGMFSTVTGEIEDGVEVLRHSKTAVGNLDFDTYHLRKEVYEAAAREAGFHSELIWDVVRVPDDFMEQSGKYGEDENGRAGAEELATYKQLPFCGTLLLTNNIRVRWIDDDC